MAMKVKRNKIRNKLREISSRIDHIKHNINMKVESATDNVKPYLKEGVDRVRPHIDNGKAHIEKATEDGIAFAINHKGEVVKYAGRAAKGAVVVARKSKKTGIAIGTGLALIGLVSACKRSMDKANKAKARAAMAQAHEAELEQAQQEQQEQQGELE